MTMPDDRLPPELVIAGLIDALRGIGSWDTVEGWCWCKPRTWGPVEHQRRCQDTRSAVKEGEKFV
jgi:hypothetical protein